MTEINPKALDDAYKAWSHALSGNARMKENLATAITAYLAAVQPDEPSEVAVRKMRSDWPDRQADALIIAEREACAKMMDDHAEAAKQMSQEARYPILGKFYQYRSEAYAHGAAVIRARTA